MLERMSSRHLTEWNLLFQIKAEEAEDGEDGNERVGIFEPEGRTLLGMGESGDDTEDDGESDDDE